MDNSTEGVTLLTGFVFDVLKEYEHMKKTAGPIFKLAEGLDPKKTDAVCSITVYNDICTWVEQNIGIASIRKAGVAIGNRAFDNIVANQKLTKPTPLAMMEALKWAASVMIQDPKGRGWEIVSSDDFSVLMRRTQSFNCMLQEGLLTSLAERTGVQGLDVDHVKCTRKGDPFCEYRLSWVKNP